MKKQLLALTILAAAALPAAAWDVIQLPNLSQSFGAYQMGHLSDGRLVYGSTNDLDRQDTFGGAALSDYTNGSAWDPSDVELFSDTLGVLGVGGFGGTALVVFNPTNIGTSFTSIPSISLQNYAFTFRDSLGLYVNGGNGSQLNGFGFSNSAVSYVSLDGSVNKVIIDNVSSFSGDIAKDTAGNLFVTNNDSGALYKFTASQLSNAITGTALTVNDGQLVTTLDRDASFAVDTLGRIWSAGYQAAGIKVYDPSNGQSQTYTPGANNENYVVETFTKDGEGYVAFINASDSSAGSTLIYGTEKANALIPEPASLGLLAIGALALARRRRTTAR